MSEFLIRQLIANERIDFEGGCNIRTGEVRNYPLIGKWEYWEFEIKSPSWLEIRGSLHKSWNNGTNENDFTYWGLFQSIKMLCEFLQVSPKDITIHNLEFGVNIRPGINASQILKEVICYKNSLPIRPIDNERGFFIEFRVGNYYLKMYDKGLQANANWKINAGNILRFEIKAMNSRFISDANIKTLEHLLCHNNLMLLCEKLYTLFDHLVFDDSTIKPGLLSTVDRKVYDLMCNPKKWIDKKKEKTSTIRAREKRFKGIVEKHGQLKLSSVLVDLIRKKCNELLYVPVEVSKEINDWLQSFNKK